MANAGLQRFPKAGHVSKHVRNPLKIWETKTASVQLAFTGRRPQSVSAAIDKGALKFIAVV